MRSSSVTTRPRPTSPEARGLGRLVLRADGGDAVGVGHVGRCLALAEAWSRAGGEAVLALTPGALADAERLGAAVPVVTVAADPGSAEDERRSRRLAEGGWLVVDGYRFGDLAWSGDHRLAVIRDRSHGPGATAELVVDQNLGATPADGVQPTDRARFLLGPRYALLRRGAGGRSRPRPSTPPRRVVVLGGGTPDATVTGHLTAVIADLATRRLEVDVLGGLAVGDLAQQARVHEHGFLADPTRVLAGADLAVTAAGSTVYELAHLGIPAVAIAFHENQAPIAAALAAIGAALASDAGAPDRTVELIDRLRTDADLRAEVSRSAIGLVDGRGAERVVEALAADP